MSDYERFKGEIQLIPRNENESDKDYFERATNKPYSYDLDGIQDYDCIYEAIYENSIYKDFICIGNNIYRFNELKSLDPYGSYCNVQKIEEGKYKFETMFYNGGTCLSEMLSSELKKL